jgi:hypothetical protein
MPSHPAGKALPSLATAIPTKDRPQELARTLESVLAQSAPPKRVVIMDQSATEASREVSARFAENARRIPGGIEFNYVLDRKISGLTAARNRSLRLVEEDVVLFLDDDVYLEKDFNRELRQAYIDNPEAAGIGGVITNYSPPPAGFRWWSAIFARGPFHDERQPLYWRAARGRRGRPVRVRKLGGGLMSFKMKAITAGAGRTASGDAEGAPGSLSQSHSPVPKALAVAVRGGSVFSLREALEDRPPESPLFRVAECRFCGHARRGDIAAQVA